jgi:hypothetical protein
VNLKTSLAACFGPTTRPLELVRGWSPFDAIREVQYKPGWHFHLKPNDHNYAFTLIITCEVPDANAPEGLRKVIPITMRREIDTHHLNPDLFLVAITCAIRDMEMHEMDEWFRIQGHRVKEPHPHG